MDERNDYYRKRHSYAVDYQFDDLSLAYLFAFFLLVMALVSLCAFTGGCQPCFGNYPYYPYPPAEGGRPVIRYELARQDPPRV